MISLFQFKHLVCCNNYEYDSELDQCNPICNHRCANGQCVEPNTCQCNEGFKTDPNNAFNCIPICEPECVHGYCAAPNECKCNIGYVEIENRTVCKPVCVGCEFGQCVEPNNCACFEGYERTNFTCKPRCSSCSNGDCVAPETCRYSLDNNPTQSPYTICNKGYDLVCSVICNHGYCTPPRNCTCKPKKKGAIFNL